MAHSPGNPAFQQAAAHQAVRIGGRTFLLVPQEEFERLTRDDHLTDDMTAYAESAVGREIRLRRRKAGLTQGEVARLAGVRLETVSRLENGHGNSTLRTVRAVLQALGSRE